MFFWSIPWFGNVWHMIDLKKQLLVDHMHIIDFSNLDCFLFIPADLLTPFKSSFSR